MFLLNKLWGYVLGVGALAVAVLAALGLARRSGVKAERQAQTERALKESKEANGIDAKVRSMSGADIADELRKHQRD